MPVYEQLLQRMLQGSSHKKPKRSNKVFVESQVQIGSFMDGKTLSEIGLPPGSLIVSVQRAGRELVPGGQTALTSGDTLVILCHEGNLSEVNQTLDEKCRRIILQADAGTENP